MTDTTRWAAPTLQAFKDSLSATGYRVLLSGYPGETAADLTARLPWLLQPGVDVFLYDERLAGPAGLDSLQQALERMNHPAEVLNFE
ncbi:MAG: hypothetical protein AAF840_06935 [Bacteroidota bacterium]